MPSDVSVDLFRNLPFPVVYAKVRFTNTLVLDKIGPENHSRG